MTPATQRQLRRWHLNLGVLFTPLILLFSISGALQTFGFHEPKGTTPPTWIAWLASVHKHQRLPGPPKVKQVGDQRGVTNSVAAPAGKPRTSVALQVFVGLMSIGLALSSLIGVTIAVNSRSTRLASIVMIAIGALIPLGVLYL